MAKVPYGITGPFIGRVGNLIGYMLNGVNVIRSIGKVHGEKTPKQLANHQRMGLISNLSTTIQEFLKFGFQSVAAPGKQGPTNHSISINKEVAVKGEYPNQVTDFTKLIVAQGTIPVPKNPLVKVVDNGLEYNWKADLQAEGAEKTDQIMLLAYFPETKKAIIMASGARRTVEKEILELPEFDTDTVIETYIAYVSDDRMNASNSIYLGQLTISPALELPEERLIRLGKPQQKEEGYSDLFYYGSGYHTQTERMKMLSPFLTLFKEEINLGFQHGIRRTTPFNKAVSRNINTAIGGDEIFNFYFPAMVFSAGKRETAWGTKLSLANGNEVTVKWDVPKTAKMTVIGDDEPCFIFYNSTRNEQTGEYLDSKRKDLSTTRKMKGAKPGDIIYCYMFFVSPDKKSVSNTDYLGCVEIW